MKYETIKAARISLGEILKRGRKKGKTYEDKYLDLYVDYLENKGMTANNIEDNRRYFVRLEKAISSRDYYELAAMLHKDNKFSRAIFEAETGVRLPVSNSATLEEIRKWAGYTTQRIDRDKRLDDQKKQAEKSVLDNQLREEVKKGLQRTSSQKRDTRYIVSFIFDSGKIKNTNAKPYNESLLKTVEYKGKRYAYWEFIEFLVDSGYTTGKEGNKLILTLTNRSSYFVINRYAKEYALFYEDKSGVLRRKEEDDDLGLGVSDEDINHLFGELPTASPSQLYKKGLNSLRRRTKMKSVAITISKVDGKTIITAATPESVYNRIVQSVRNIMNGEKPVFIGPTYNAIAPFIVKTIKESPKALDGFQLHLYKDDKGNVFFGDVTYRGITPEIYNKPTLESWLKKSKIDPKQLQEIKDSSFIKTFAEIKREVEKL